MPWPTTSRHERGYGRAWEKARKAALYRDKHLCQPCLRNHRVTPATQVDHITPKAKGGTDDMDNLQSICGPCHLTKSLADEGKRVKVETGVDGWPE